MLTQLSLRCTQENKLEALPDVSALKYLQVLNANTNSIGSVRGLSSRSLIDIALNGMAMLSLLRQRVGCIPHPPVVACARAVNELTSFEGLGALPSLRRLEASNNKITTTSGISSASGVQELILVRRLCSRPVPSIPPLTVPCVGHCVRVACSPTTPSRPSRTSARWRRCRWCVAAASLQRHALLLSPRHAPTAARAVQLVLSDNALTGAALASVDWRSLSSLRELSLSRNKIDAVADLAPLAAAPALTVQCAP